MSKIALFATAGAIGQSVAAGVTRILLIGTVYPYGRPQTTPVREDRPREPHAFKCRMRKAQVRQHAGRQVGR